MKIILKIAGAILLLLPLLSVAQAGAQKPNIVFIIADDLGYGNLTSFNQSSKIPTPNIDAIGKEGVRFTRFYSGSTVCAPSRAALMTGRHMGHAYIRGNANVPLREQDTVLVQRLKKAGYRTGMFGKWGLGEEGEAGAPQLKGFDAFFGYMNQTHAHNYFPDHLFQVKEGSLSRVQVDTTKYSEDLIINAALSFLEENRSNPFFLYLPLTIPHAELRVPDSLLKPFLNKDGTSKFEPETPFPGKATYRAQAKPRAAFAAMVTKLDTDVGRVLDRLKALGLTENTYVFFTSDNGPHIEGGADPIYFNSGGGLRGVKRDLYEGGIRVPLLVRSPDRKGAGKTDSSLLAFWDVLPTICSITNTPSPGNIDGISFTNALEGKQQTRRHDYLYWQFNEGGLKEALLQDDWKLIRFKQQGKPEVVELYNLRLDESEKNNVALQNSGKVAALKALMQKAKTPAEHPKFDWRAEEQ